MLLCSITGYDASGKIEELAAESGKQLHSIAIGSPEGFSAAERAIESASRSGHWVLFKNVHLSNIFIYLVFIHKLIFIKTK